MVELKIIQDQKEFKIAIDSLADLNMTDLHSDLGEEGRNIIEKRFDMGVDPSGKQWDKIKKYYNFDHKRWRLPSDRPLKLKNLYKSFSYDANDDGVSIGTPLKYSKYHTNAPKNNGKTRTKIPLREFMGFESQEDIKSLKDIVLEHIEMAVN